jgi:lipopolysaccharide transport system ATP-binding protein
MSNIAIKAEDISKAYQLGEFSTGSLSRDLHRAWMKLRGKEDPFLKIGETNDRTKTGSSNIVWSLKDINFEIAQGDAIGIIGRNGAGKSTLLKILSKVTSPTTGSITGRGRIASLLEVGTGFHPELTGRENIYLNGAILGMRKAEIKRKFDEIVDFSGVERYIDTPVKRYSSGMYVRLAFAVAAHLESEILIVDEVLAVGDAEFQKKCLGKMGHVSKSEGRTVLFVSHNIAAVKQLCNTGLVLDKGTIGFSGDINPAITYYKNQNLQGNELSLLKLVKYSHFNMAVNKISVNEKEDTRVILDPVQGDLNIVIQGYASQSYQANIEIRIYTLEDTLVAFFSPGHMDNELIDIKEGEFTFTSSIRLPTYMTNGEYYINIQLSYPGREMYFGLEGITVIKVGETTSAGRTLSYNDIGFFLIKKQ